MIITYCTFFSGTQKEIFLKNVLTVFIHTLKVNWVQSNIKTDFHYMEQKKKKKKKRNIC